MRFAPRVPFAELPALIAGSDVTLGIFGTVAPAARVIPFKVFDGLAMARPVITADTPAAREALVDGEHCRLTPPGDAAALAEAITALHDDEREAAAMAGRGHELYRARCLDRRPGARPRCRLPGAGDMTMRGGPRCAA